MAEFSAALINEIEKLYRKKKVLVAIIISIIFIVLGQLAVTLMRNGFGLRGVSSMEFPMLVLSLVVNTILPLFTALVAIDSFSGEFSSNTMKIGLTRPITRLKFYSAKIVAIGTFILANLVFLMVLSLAAGLIFNSDSFSMTSLLRVIVAYTVTVFPMMILTLIIAFMANILRSGISVFFLSIFVFLIFKGIGVVMPRFSGVLFTSMTDWYNLFIMTPIPGFKVFLDLLMMLSYGILFFTGGYYLFDKKEF